VSLQPCRTLFPQLWDCRNKVLLFGRGRACGAHANVLECFVGRDDCPCLCRPLPAYQRYYCRV
jgi:hypothetical protein